MARRKSSTNRPKSDGRFKFKAVAREFLCDAMVKSVDEILARWVAATYAADHPDLFGDTDKPTTSVAGRILGEQDDDER